MVEILHPFDQAAQVARDLVPAATAESVPVDRCLGRLLAAKAVARVDVPPFDRAMMDGFAISIDGETSVGTTYPVVGRTVAGDAPWQPLPTGAAVRIMTGAPMPPGANAVVRFEWCEQTHTVHDTEHSVRLLRAVRAGESVQPRGQDGTAGSAVLSPGVRLAGAHLALARTFGISELSVAHRPSCTVIVTGSELEQNPAAVLGRGQIYGANDAYLRGALHNDGVAVQRCDYVGDDPAAIRDLLERASRESEFVVLTGGVSAGDHDFVPAVIDDLGGQVAVRRVLLRPGSPFLAATIGKAVVFALSGNPAAGFVQFETLVRPAIRAAMGWQDAPFPASGRLVHDELQKPVKHTRVLRATAWIEHAEVNVDARMAQASGQIASFAAANCLIRLDEPRVAAGTVVPLRFLDHALCPVR